MLRVASIGEAIAQGWQTKGEVDCMRVVKTLLIHDMANILKYDFDSSLHLMGKEQKNAAYWKRVQEECAVKYGSNEHFAVLQIARELGMDTQSISLLEKMPAVHDGNHIGQGDWELKICFYADFRAAPFSITTTDERMDDLIKREAARHTPQTEITRLEGIKKYLHTLEEELQNKTSYNLSALQEDVFREGKEKLLHFSWVE